MPPVTRVPQYYLFFMKNQESHLPQKYLCLNGTYKQKNHKEIEVNCKVYIRNNIKEKR
jgi:hypothetical protein